MDYSKLTKEQVIEGIKNQELDFYDLLKEHQQDKEILLEAIKNSNINDISLIRVLKNYRDDKDVFLCALKKNGNRLQYASERLKDEEEVVLEAVKENGSCLGYASERLRNNKEVVLVAIKKDVMSLQHASERLQNDKDCLTELDKFFFKNKFNTFILNIKWYKERMVVLANIREKELMENSIISSDVKSKKIKF